MLLPWIQDLTAQYGVGELLTGTVLVVDDEPPNLDVLQTVLETEYRILVATNGATALRLAETNPIDIVITDQRMAEMTGVELLERIRSIKPDVAGIVITAYSDTPALMSAINQARAFRYIKKPWQPEDLIQAITEAGEHVYQTRAILRLVELLAKRSDELSKALAEVRAAQEHVLHMERLSNLGRFATGVIHDLRNSLLGMAGLTKELSEYDVPEELVDDAQLGLSGLHNLLGQLESIYQYSRSSRLNVELEDIDPAKLIETSLKILRMDLKTRVRTIQSRIQPGMAPLRGDLMKLVQVLVNLLRNAVQATTEEQTISIEVSADSGGVRITVEDTGSGIAPELRPNLFRAFASGRPERGMGMGLYMSKLIVEAHRGRIVCLDRVGGGTRFEILIPSARAA
jgi:signal transduction histidine kinase